MSNTAITIAVMLATAVALWLSIKRIREFIHTTELQTAGFIIAVLSLEIGVLQSLNMLPIDLRLLLWNSTPSAVPTVTATSTPLVAPMTVRKPIVVQGIGHQVVIGNGNVVSGPQVFH